MRLLTYAERLIGHSESSSSSRRGQPTAGVIVDHVHVRRQPNGVRRTRFTAMIDGGRLAKLMIDHDVGVTPATTYRLKRIDQDYFVESD
jgi:restriction endonuclease Mrr